MKLTIWILGLSLVAGAVTAGSKVTYDDAIKSHESAYGNYKGLSHSDSQSAWDSVNHKPGKNGDGGGGALTTVWTGKSQSVANKWGDGAYLFDLGDPYNASETVATVWVYVNSSNHTKKRGGGPSHYGYEKSWWIVYEGGTFKAIGASESKPFILSIAKAPVAVKMYNDCTPGQRQTTSLYCQSGYKTCEPGVESRTCAANGTWGPYSTDRLPQCAYGNQMCR
ncbi:hypothetical protein [Shewanella algae]|jgi:hypothetical protein|uniref:hypothetical protein n=1 Tax=Shewanella algae TaxID=38313 RepID=UPI0011828CC2|nr:hypothetical protein [Shewanella algae]MBO2558956.1 hypothetical protein [Shewanella algae]MBO2575891.1 hypothetical protein [Shewanella algae]TVO83384.1 hypothetical protein AYI80_19400 [Shewanella algae]TXS83027.1 hypothetical protein AYI81_20470 [Shewanella algae]